MNRSIRVILTLLALYFVTLAVSAVPLNSAQDVNTTGSSALYDNVILISWEGVQREHIKECLFRNELPNLARIIDEGTITELYLSTSSATKSGSAEMLTGYFDTFTGIYDDGNFQPIPEGYTILERVQKFGNDNGIVTGMVTADADNFGSKSPGTDIISGDEKGGATEAPFPHQGQPFHLTSKAITVWDGDKDRNAEEVTSRAVELINSNKDKPFFYFFHYTDPDKAGHQYGENSTEYNSAIRKCDEQLGQILTALESAGVENNTGVFVTTDHGFMEGGYWHFMDLNTWLATNTHRTLRWGHVVDLAPTIYRDLGIDYGQFSPPLSGTPLSSSAPTWQPLTTQPKYQENVPEEIARVIKAGGRICKRPGLEPKPTKTPKVTKKGAITTSTTNQPSSSTSISATLVKPYITPLSWGVYGMKRVSCMLIGPCR
jgi:predicted AlkP superfamily pyrophosphatase or phosphodiesterase